MSVPLLFSECLLCVELRLKEEVWAVPPEYLGSLDHIAEFAGGLKFPDRGLGTALAD